MRDDIRAANRGQFRWQRWSAALATMGRLPAFCIFRSAMAA